ncbi:unnamed protein product [Clonostachys rhizophaga]|uniref:Uncharacterized protein n=1 Tax=Clonostachys rhizophaga TaxID=160324 RepID=A0A9N9V1X1_9HYPO|nr:unnamed protein product [Clonostachys rhizophaga]
MASNPRILVRQATILVDGKSSSETHSRRIAAKHHSGNGPSLNQLPEAWDTFIADMTGMHSVAALRRSLVAHGRSHGAVCLVVAITLNHMRRLLFPAATQFFWPHALADMKLARSSPHRLLEQSVVSFDWLPFVAWAVFTYLLAMLPALLGQLVTAHCGRGSSRATAAACIVAYVAASLAWAEHAYVQSCWTLAQLYACWRLVSRGGDAERAFLQKLLEEQSARATAVLGLVALGLHFRVLPVAQQAVRGHWPGVLVYLGMGVGTAYMVRYSNKFFILLELADMWITLAWFGGAFVLHGMEVLRRRVEADDRAGKGPGKGASHVSKTR